MMVLKGKVALLHHRIPPFLPPLPLSVTFERNLCCFRDISGARRRRLAGLAGRPLVIRSPVHQ
jgi:hypothetical protein